VRVCRAFVFYVTGILLIAGWSVDLHQATGLSAKRAVCELVLSECNR